MIAKLKKTGLYCSLVAIAVLVLIPFYWMLNTSLKTEAEALAVPPGLAPSAPRFYNYVDAMITAPFLTYFANTIIVAFFVVLISTVVTILASFAFARLNFRFKNLLFFIVLGTMMIPQEMLIITNFITVAKLGWLNSWQALILPFCINPFNIYLLRQTFMQIPDELYLAARVDGLTVFAYLRKVAVPMAKSTILTIMILSMIWIWNTYAWPNLVTTKDGMRLVSNGLKNAFTTSTGNIRYELQMAAAMLVTLPLIVIFICLKKHIISGIAQGGIKG